jgi:hypothetical protein
MSFILGMMNNGKGKQMVRCKPACGVPSVRALARPSMPSPVFIFACPACNDPLPPHTGALAIFGCGQGNLPSHG